MLGAREGALKGTLLAGSIIALCHWRYPWMRRQTLAGKAFLTFWGSALGMTVYADKYLIRSVVNSRAPTPNPQANEVLTDTAVATQLGEGTSRDQRAVEDEGQDRARGQGDRAERDEHARVEAAE